MANERNGIPSDVYRVIKGAVAAHLSDIDRSVEVAHEEITNLPGYKLLAQNLMLDLVRRLVHEERHNLANAQRHESGFYAKNTAKVVASQSAIYRQVAKQGNRERFLNYPMGGKVLGDLTGKDLDRVAKAEGQAMKGHEFNMRLAQYFREDGIGDNEKVRNRYKESSVEEIFAAIAVEVKRNATAGDEVNNED